ncbi:unnamed protein product [Urochloa humidicola]
MGGGGRRVPRWGLPPARSKLLGKLGPSFGAGAGCGVGVVIGLIGGVGPGFPGLRLGFGVGAGCGIGIGFGYGFGKGVAYDGNGKYSNIGISNQKSQGAFPSEEQIDILVDEMIENTKRLIKVTLKEIDKWRRA